jgi:hypothetical protein
MKTTTYILPAYWASALINADESGMENKEIEEINAWLDRVKPGYCVGCSDNEHFAHGNDANSLGGDVLEFYFHKQVTTHTPGPWHVAANALSVMSGDVIVGHAKNNTDAKFIAAAPELLKALKQAKEDLTFLYAQNCNGKFWSEKAELNIAKIREAISKAEGHE